MRLLVKMILVQGENKLKEFREVSVQLNMPTEFDKINAVEAKSIVVPISLFPNGWKIRKIFYERLVLFPTDRKWIKLRPIMKN